MPVQLDSVQSSPDFPVEVDAAVVGGGIIGTCTAYELARKGKTVALFEKGVVGGEQSSRNWGWVRHQNRDLHEVQLAMLSVDRWEALGPELGRELGFRRTGSVYTTTDPATLAKWEAWCRAAGELGFVSHMLTAKQTKERAPGTVSDWIGGVWAPTDARAEPSLAVPAIAEGAKALGVSLHQNCAVRGLEVTNGAVAGVWTEHGLVRAPIVVVAGGAWTSRLLRRYGIELPVANILGTVVRTRPANDVLSAGSLNTSTLSVRRRIDGGYTVAVPGFGTLNIAPQAIRYATKFYQMYRAKVAKKLKYRLDSSFWNGPEASGRWENDQVSPFERIRILDPAPDPAMVRLTIENLQRELPALRGVEVAASWGGMIDTSPDLVPVISRTKALAGLVIASGLSGHGFGIGPGVGMLASQIALGETTCVDAAPFRLSRFSDGSAIHRPGMM